MILATQLALFALLVSAASADLELPDSTPRPRSLSVNGRLPAVKRETNVKRFNAAPNIGIGGVSFTLGSSVSSPHAKRNGNGSIIALASEENIYAIPVGLGDPGYAYPLHLDTGSADLIVASTECGNDCPASTDFNPYYDPKRHSNTFLAVNDNKTSWTSHYGDGSVARGIIARERVSIASVVLEGQVFGIMNATNMTLAEQRVSGVLGLGFPRLSTFAQTLLHNHELPLNVSAIHPSDPFLSTEGNGSRPDAASATGSGSADPDATASAQLSGQSDDSPTSSTPILTPRQETSLPGTSTGAATDASTSLENLGSTLAPSVTAVPSYIPPETAPPSYLPPVLESLFSTTAVPYPVFGLALQAPPDHVHNDSAIQEVTDEHAASFRYTIVTGSLTLGGVSELFVSSNASTGRTVNDIQWWPVVPFAPLNRTLPEPPLEPTATPNASTVENGVPKSAAELESESYLYWALELSNVAVNGTGVGLNSSYSSIGVPSIALLDLGTNGIYGPQQDVEKIFRNITDARQVSTGQWVVPCDLNATLGFSFGGNYVELQPQDWIYAAVPHSTLCLAWPVAVPSAGDGVDWQLGTPFLKSVYTVFSYGINGVQSPQIGFLPLQDVIPAGNTSAVPTPVVPATPTITVGTTLPNLVLTGPNFATPSYIFATGGPPTSVQTMGLANASVFTVAPVPVVSLPRSQSQSTGTTNIPNVPGWPGNSTEQALSASHQLRASMLLVVLGTVLACL